MTIFTRKQALVISYLCLVSFLIASPAIAESRWSQPDRSQKDNQHLKKESPAKDNRQRRDFAKDKSRETKHEITDGNYGRADANQDSQESRHDRQQRRTNVKHKPSHRLVGDRHKNDDKSANEPRERRKDQQRSSDFQDYTDRTGTRQDFEDYKERHQQTPENHSHQERRKNNNHTRHRRDPVVVKHEGTHQHKHRPKYNLYRRHQHIYYRSPWYNTYYIAPIHYHYHPLGYHVRVLPQPYVRIVVSGLPYFYFGGVFYRSFDNGYVVVSAPIGAVVHTLPVGFIAFSVGVSTFYYVNDTYYVWDEPREAYLVVEKPEGADKAIADATTGRLFVYPKEGQSEEQQARDRYECHRWAVTESAVDPTLEDETYSQEQKRDYQRAMGACLEGRGYTVK